MASKILAPLMLGLALALGALALIALQSKQMGAVAHMDWVMLVFTFLLSIFAAVMAGLRPERMPSAAITALPWAWAPSAKARRVEESMSSTASALRPVLSSILPFCRAAASRPASRSARWQTR